MMDSITQTISSVEPNILMRDKAPYLVVSADQDAGRRLEVLAGTPGVTDA